MLEQQRIKDEKNRTKAEKQKQLSMIEAFNNEKDQWNQFLAQLSQRIYTTQKENDVDTTEAIKKAKSLLNLAGLIPSENKDKLAQELKSEFSKALLKSERPITINIHKNMAAFNTEMNRIID